MSAEQKVTIVTGASQGIGGEILHVGGGQSAGH
jgi:NAD(P)-dependent dehydrogenase (short-subunit alcohol dehydrogenase family)